MQTVADPSQTPAVRPRRRTRKGLLSFILIVALIVGGIAYPPSFLFTLRQVLYFDAWRYGFHLTIGDMTGSVTEPILMDNVRLTRNSSAGTVTALEIDKARTSFAWRHLIWQRDSRIWHDLALDGLRGTIDLPSSPQPAARDAAAPLRAFAFGKNPRLILPSSLAVTHASITVSQGKSSVRLEDADLQAGDLEAGHLNIGTLSVNEPWMSSVFSNCHGTLLLQDSQLMLADMKLTDTLAITSASADLPDLLRGQLKMEFALAAFSGKIQGELRSGAHEEHLQFESSGTFQNISVAQLGAFFGEDADGSITEGKFTFSGSPRDLEKATFTTRFEAGAFRWGARKWNSLIAGATYVNRRLLIPEFHLTQAHNSLVLQGDMSVPGNWHEWWKSDFNFTVAAKIDNLTELSDLLGPGFGDTYGKLTVDGSIRGEKASFNGQLIVSGSHLSFRKAPLDQLQAAIKVDGNEIQVTNAEFTHGDDFLRAHGVVNILGEKRYWGEVKASIADLALYASFLQPPIAPEAYGGGLMLDWSGDGAAQAHSGAFTVRLNHLHPLATSTSGTGGTDAETWLPIDLNATGTYSPESVFFSNLVLGNGQTTLSSRVVANPSSLTLQSLKVSHGKATWLTGDAQIPLNAWAAWENPETASWWNFQSPCKVDLKFDRLSVRDTTLLSGHPQPFEGEITGNLKSDGKLSNLTADGHLAIKNAAGTVTTGALKNANAALDFKGDKMTVNSASGIWNGVSWATSGSVVAPDVHTPKLDLAIKIPTAMFSLAAGVKATSSLDVEATGSLGTAAITGSAQLQTLMLNSWPTNDSLVENGKSGLGLPIPPLAIPGPVEWSLDLAVSGTAVLNDAAKVIPALVVTGSFGKPVVSGNIAFRGCKINDGPLESDWGVPNSTLLDGIFFLNQSDPSATALTIHASGFNAGIFTPGKNFYDQHLFDGYIYGTVGYKHFTWPPDVTAALAMRPGDTVLNPLPAGLPFKLQTTEPNAAPLYGAPDAPARP